jgi:hypothetical protein
MAEGFVANMASSLLNGGNTPARTPRPGTPITTHLTVPGLNHKIHEKLGYTDTTFHGKEKQLQIVIKALQAKGFIPNELVENEVNRLFSTCSNWARLDGSTEIWALTMSTLPKSPSTL